MISQNSEIINKPYISQKTFTNDPIIIKNTGTNLILRNDFTLWLILCKSQKSQMESSTVEFLKTIFIAILSCFLYFISLDALQ